ncbi:metallophosphoesterase family protein [Clostridium cellulovorans]|uniref:Metallophosphoesterase n=1 Tax=Clostridium cellulovorans (strain ATCC 35296 / DSM 3052 / OCM 3 / 743B) TaxID=573061 RepID=D9SSM4_CLOC7|nr:metallophosphoesterase [Clostridium cellulovorans]ADL50621.1 metallophosphoesterase [Clostridium cellulovorans 743B]
MLNLLHISDLHFGFDKDTTQKSLRDNFLNDFFNYLREIANDKPFDYVFITGDIGYSAKESDYDEARIWIKKLLECVNLKVCNLYICPGNHDVDRNYLDDKEFPQEQLRANKLLKVERLQNLKEGFINYSNFCRRLGVETYLIDNNENYLIGVHKTSNLNIIGVNTSWLAKSDEVEDQMWVGANFLQVIKSQNSLNPNLMTITIFHHPKEFWNSNERSTYYDTKNTYDLACKLSDMVLFGHTHELTKKPDRWDTPFICGTGAVYDKNTYSYNFKTYEIDEHQKTVVQVCEHRFDSNSWGKVTTLRNNYYDIEKNSKTQTITFFEDNNDFISDIKKYSKKVEFNKDIDEDIISYFEKRYLNNIRDKSNFFDTLWNNTMKIFDRESGLLLYNVLHKFIALNKEFCIERFSKDSKIYSESIQMNGIINDDFSYTPKYKKFSRALYIFFDYPELYNLLEESFKIEFKIKCKENINYFLLAYYCNEGFEAHLKESRNLLKKVSQKDTYRYWHDYTRFDINTFLMLFEKMKINEVNPEIYNTFMFSTIIKRSYNYDCSETILNNLIPAVIPNFSDKDVVELLNEFNANSQYRELGGYNHYDKSHNDLWYYLKEYKDIIINKVGRDYILDNAKESKIFEKLKNFL